MKHYIDMSPVVDMRMLWPKNTKINEDTFIGIYNNFFMQEDILSDYPMENDGISFIFYKNKEELDSLECKGQILNVPSIQCVKIHFAGMCGWGYFKEKAELKFADGTIDYAKICYSDICWPLKDALYYKFGIEKEEFIDASRIFYKGEGRERPVHIYHYTTTFEKTRILTQIRFPDNILMIIMAITVED